MVKGDLLEEKASEFGIITHKERRNLKQLFNPVLSNPLQNSLLGLVTTVQSPGPHPRPR